MIVHSSYRCSGPFLGTPMVVIPSLDVFIIYGVVGPPCTVIFPEQHEVDLFFDNIKAVSRPELIVQSASSASYDHRLVHSISCGR